MAYNELNNEESGLVIRQKINEMFAEIYTILFGGDDSSGQTPLNLWTLFEDTLTPVDDIEVRVKLLKAIEGLNIADLFTINADGDIHITSLAPSNPGSKRLSIDETGLITSDWVDAQSFVFITTNQTISTSNYALFVDSSSDNVLLQLPAISSCIGKSFHIRKVTAPNQVILNAAGTDIITRGDISASNFTLWSQNDWVVVRATMQNDAPVWIVESDFILNTDGVSAGGGGVKYLKISVNYANLSTKFTHIGAGANSQNVYLNLPQISTVGSVRFVIRKITPGSYVVSINRSGLDLIYWNVTETNEIFATEQGSFIELVSDPETMKWNVMMHGGNWAI